MYNRYIPQNDGTYRRSRVPDAPHPEPVRAPRAPSEPEKSVPSEPAPPVPPEPPAASAPQQRSTAPGATGHNTRPEPRHDPQGTNVMGFLKQILPQNFDTGDLIVVLLLLLMSENRKDNTALLTLVIYLFL